ncbi:MAG: uncharacterized membrane protein YsdA (DUF1294 family) [Planctomycetota bacterium]|jgi:uncharacterized membrane protein YsdA (DUF1294 family)
MKFLQNPIRISFGLFLFLALASGGSLWHFLGWHPLLAWVLGANVAAPPVWWIDKHQAGREGLRVPEMALHLIAAVGAVPASWLSMSMFRHKTRKPIFRYLYLVLLLLQVGAFAWWLGLMG